MVMSSRLVTGIVYFLLIYWFGFKFRLICWRILHCSRFCENMKTMLSQIKDPSSVIFFKFKYYRGVVRFTNFKPNQKKTFNFSLAKICVLLSYFYVGECNTGVVGCAKERQVVNLRMESHS